MKHKWILSLLPAMISFGPAFMVLFNDTARPGGISTSSLLGAFMLSGGLVLMYGMICLTEKKVTQQAAMIDDLRKIIAAKHPGIEFGPPPSGFIPVER